MIRALALAISLALALLAWPVQAQTIPTYTFATLPGSPTAGQLAWITDGAATPIPGTAEIGGGTHKDLVAYDSTQVRWEFVQRAPDDLPPEDLPTFLSGDRISYDNASSGAAADNVQDALDEIFAGGGGGGGGGGSTNLSTSVGASTVTVNSDTGTDAIIPAATTTTAGILSASDRKKFDGAFDQTIVLDDPATACGAFASAMRTYADGTAADGDYQVRVVYKLTGASALVPQTHFYKDSGGQWPYRACFMLHPQAAGAYIGSFPDSLGRVTANAAAVVWDSGIHLTIHHEGKIELDETGLAEDAVLFEIGNNYMAGCVDALLADGKCDSGTFFGTIAGGVSFRGSVDVRIKTKNESGWTGEGTFSMSPTERFSSEVENDLVILATNGATYADLGSFKVRYQNTDHSDVVWHSVGSSGMTPPQLDGVAQNDGYGAIFYGPQNWSAPSRHLNLRQLDYSVLLGDRLNGGKIITYSGCDAATGVTNGVCGEFRSATTGVLLDGAMLEGPAYSSLVIPDLGYYVQLDNVYLETGPSSRHSVALGPYFCDGVSGTSPKPQGTVVKELSDCAASGGSGAISYDENVPGRLSIGAAEWGAGQVGGSTILLGPGCETSDLVKLGGIAALQANVPGHAQPGEELTVSSSIASSGGCKVSVGVPAGSPPLTAYYNRVEPYLSETKNAAYLVDLAAALGAPNSGGLVNWTQLVGMPAGFADGSDDGSAGGATDLNGLTDVTLATPVVGSTLVWNGSQWVNGPLDLADSDARTGVLPDANVSDTITASLYMPTAGGAFSGTVTMNSGAQFLVGPGAALGPVGGGIVQASQFLGSGTLTTGIDLATSEVSGILQVANGGTGASSFTSGGILLGTGALAPHATPVLTAGQILIGDGTTDPTIAALSGDVAMTSGGVVSLNTNTVDANELVSTGVSPGTYQNANVTVDQDGRVTAITAGSSLVIASGTKALATTSIAAGACNTDTITATGVVSTDVVTWNPNADLSTVVGYRPISGDGLAIYPPVPSANLITVKACNPTASSITPGLVTLNYRVVR